MNKHENFYDDIRRTLQKKVDEICCDKNFEWDDECPPKFHVSILSDDLDNQSIVLTIIHHNEAFTETLFPRADASWGYENLGKL